MRRSTYGYRTLQSTYGYKTLQRSSASALSRPCTSGEFEYEWLRPTRRPDRPICESVISLHEPGRTGEVASHPGCASAPLDAQGITLVGAARLDRIASDSAICHGQPTVRGLRYTVETLSELSASGMTVDEIVGDHPGLERDDLLAVLEFSSARWLTTRRPQGRTCRRRRTEPGLHAVPRTSTSSTRTARPGGSGWVQWASGGRASASAACRTARRGGTASSRDTRSRTSQLTSRPLTARAAAT